MTYNEWRDELKNNLLTVSDAERRRVLDYYAEAYADRREAGYSEREIIDGFGAPYDAAQRILSESTDDYYQEPRRDVNTDGRRNNAQGNEQRYDERENFSERNEEQHHDKRCSTSKPACCNKETTKSRDDYTWVFVLLCIIFAIPLFCVVMAMVGVTIGLSVAPFAMIISGIGSIGTGIGTMFTNPAAGVFALGCGLVFIGLGIILIPLCIKLVKLMWKWFNMFFRWIRGLFSGKEKERT